MTLGRLARKLVPLSLSDMAMALGDPLLAITLTRLPSPEVSLAALGIVKAVANFWESPIIMMLHASTALAPQARARAALWRFMLVLSALLTLGFGLLALPPCYEVLFTRVFTVSSAVKQAAQAAFVTMLLWPALIAWRRYFQGQLIRQGRGQVLGWASLARLAAFALVLSAGGLSLGLSGALLGALALMAGITVEAGVVTWWSRSGHLPEDSQATLPGTLPGVARFYLPLAATMVVVWGGRALLVALIARSEDAPLALAVWPASWGFVILVANSTRMVQQMVITHAQDTPTRMLLQLTLLAGGLASALLLALAFTAGGQHLLGFLLGNSHSLAAAARPVLIWSWPLPGLVAGQNALQGFSIVAGRSLLVNQASLAGTALTLALAALLIYLDWPGAVAASLGVVIGVATEILILTAARPWHAVRAS